MDQSNEKTNKSTEKVNGVLNKLPKFKTPALNIKTPSLAAFRKRSFVIPTSILVLLAFGGLFFFQHKSWVFAAKVNNTLILRSELDKVMVQRYGSNTLDELVTFTLVRDELKKNNIVVTDDMLNARIAEIEAGLGGMKLEDVLKSQGQNIDDFRVQMRLELGAEDLLKDKVAVSEAEIKDFITKNAKNLTSKTPEGQRDEALKTLKSQEMQQAVSDWVNGLRTTAKIVKYL